VESRGTDRQAGRQAGRQADRDREVTANKPDTIIKNKKEKTCALIDVATPADRNVAQKETETIRT
jgi:hypothetical protein